jgi:hypothetical protein
MARFYAEIQGNRGGATRMGTPNSGMRAHVRGWNTGFKVRCDARMGDSNLDHCTVVLTGGSNAVRAEKQIASAMEMVDGTLEVTVYTPEGPIRWTV